MAITNFIPEVWAAELLSTLQKATVFGAAPVVNRDYEGDIAAFGDTVHVVSVAAPTLRTYTADSDITAAEALTDSDQTLLIDQAKAFNFQIDDINARQARNGGALMTSAAQQAAYVLRDAADQFIGARMATSASTGLGIVDAATATNLYDNLLVPASVKLDEANVPSDGRFVVLSPAAHAKLLLDSRFIKANESGVTTGLRNGIVGEAAGFTILKSNNTPTAARTAIAATTSASAKTLTSTVAGTFSQADVGLTVTGTGVDTGATIASVSADGKVATMNKNGTAGAAQTDIAIATGGPLAIAGSMFATTFAEQINKVEAYRPERRFADALKGLHLYGAKVLRPAGLVVASVKLT